MKIREFLEPASLPQASALLSDLGPDACLVSGGTAIVLMIQQGLLAPEVLVSLGRVEPASGFRDISLLESELRIGGGATLADIAGSPLVQRLFPSLASACGHAANARVRNVATIGGNLAESDYASDPPAVLASLDAACSAVRQDASERHIAVRGFTSGFLENALDGAEVLSHVTVPLPEAPTRSAYLRYSSRSAEDRPCVVVAVRAGVREGVLTDLEIVVGAVTSTLQRAPEVAASAVGRSLGDALARELGDTYADHIEPMEDARGSAWYRRRMISVLVRRALQQLDEGG